MGSRDWSTIGAGATLPRWFLWTILPPLIPLAGIAWLAARWDTIPRYFGHPLMRRTPLHVFGFLIFGAGLAALLVCLMLATWYGSRRPTTLSPMEKIPLATSYLLSVIFTGAGLASVGQIPALPIAVVVPLAVVAGIIYMVRAQSAPDDTPDNTPDECWSLNGIYHNTEDPSVFVRARAGYGYTFNMGHPWAYKMMFGLFGGIAALVGFLIWSLR